MQQNKSTEHHHATSKSHANSTQLNLRQNSSNIVSPRTAHDFTDIMGYKRMDMTNDVDQSYMLKGSKNASRSGKTGSSVNKSKDLSMEKAGSGNTTALGLE